MLPHLALEPPFVPRRWSRRGTRTGSSTVPACRGRDADQNGTIGRVFLVGTSVYNGEACDVEHLAKRGHGADAGPGTDRRGRAGDAAGVPRARPGGRPRSPRRPLRGGDAAHGDGGGPDLRVHPDRGGPDRRGPDLPLRRVPGGRRAVRLPAPPVADQHRGGRGDRGAADAEPDVHALLRRGRRRADRDPTAERAVHRGARVHRGGVAQDRVPVLLPPPRHLELDRTSRR